MIRVLRLLEYTYETVEEMETDLGRWQVPANGSRWWNPRKPGIGIKSAVLPGTTLLDVPEPTTESGRNPMIPGYCDASCAVSLEGGDRCTPLQAVIDLAVRVEALGG